MGSNLSFTAGADSPSAAGQKSILSTGIEGATADRLLEGIAKYLQDGKIADGKETSFEVTDTDGSICVHQHYSFPREWHAFILYKIDRASSVVQIQFFPEEASFNKGVAPHLGFIKVLSNPTRIEFWCEYKEMRMSGKSLKGAMDELFRKLGAVVDTEFDAPSLDDPSKLSVVSSPIECQSIDVDSFLDGYRRVVIGTTGVAELPDGTLVEERAPWLPGLGVTTYTKHIINKDESSVCCHEYMEDISMTDLVALVHVKVHREPFRLEMWREQVPARRADASQLQIQMPRFNIEDFVKRALRAMPG